MPEDKKTFLVDNNPVDVDSKDVDSFVKKFPNAIAAKTFIIDGKDTADVALKDVDSFIKKFPEAKSLYEESLKKNEILQASPPASITPSSDGEDLPSGGIKNKPIQLGYGSLAEIPEDKLPKPEPIAPPVVIKPVVQPIAADHSHILKKYNITPYATDPGHEDKVNKIYQNLVNENVETPESIDAHIKKVAPKSPITGAMIKKAADTNGVDPKAIMAIIEQDSQIGTKGLGSPQNKGNYIAVNYNPGNLTKNANGVMKTFNSWDEGVDGVAKWLKKHQLEPYTPGEQLQQSQEIKPILDTSVGESIKQQREQAEESQFSPAIPLKSQKTFAGDISKTLIGSSEKVLGAITGVGGSLFDYTYAPILEHNGWTPEQTKKYKDFLIGQTPLEGVENLSQNLTASGKKMLNEVSDIKDKSITQLMSEGKYKEAGKALAVGVAGFAPYIATAEASMPALAVGMFGESMKDLDERTDLSPSDKALLAGAHGAINSALLPIAGSGATAIFKNLAEKEGVNAAKQALAKTYSQALVQYVASQSKAVLTPVLKSYIAGVSLDLTNQVADLTLDPKLKDQSVDWKKVNDSGIMFAVPALAGSVKGLSQGVSDIKTRKKVTDQEQKLTDINMDLEKTQDPIVQQVLATAKEKTISQINDHLVEDADKFETLSPIQQSKIVEHTNIINSIDDAINEKNISEESKKALEETKKQSEKSIEEIYKKNAELIKEAEKSQAEKPVSKESESTDDGVLNEPTTPKSAEEGAVTEPVKISEEDKVRTNKEAQDLGFDSAPHAIKAVKKYLGNEYATYDEIPKSELEQTLKIKGSVKSYEDRFKKATISGSRTISELQKEGKHEFIDLGDGLIAWKVPKSDNTTIQHFFIADANGKSDQVVPIILNSKGEFSRLNEPNIKMDAKAFNENYDAKLLRLKEAKDRLINTVNNTNQKGGKNATEKRNIQEGDQQEHQDGDESGSATKTGNSNKSQQSGKKPEEKVEGTITEIDPEKVQSAIRMSQGEFVGRKIGTAKEYQQIRSDITKKIEKQNTYLAKQAAQIIPLPHSQVIKTLEDVQKEYFKKESDWLGDKFYREHEANVKAANMQKEIKDTVPKKKWESDYSYKKRWTKVDKAIHVYIDLKTNPEHLKEFYDKLSAEQKEIVDLSQNLTAEQKKIAAQVSEEYKQVGQEALDEGQIKNILDNYVARSWDLQGKKSLDLGNFQTSTRHALQRTLGSILEGWEKGYKLKVEGATNNLAILKTEIGRAIENKKFIEEGTKLKTTEGESLFLTHPEDGYQKIEAPGFKKWEYAGTLKEYDGTDMEVFGKRKDVLITEKGTVLKKVDIYAPDDIAKGLNNILGRTKLNELPGVETLSKWSNRVKSSLFLTSLFHHIAFARAHLLAGGDSFFNTKNLNPLSAYKKGLQQIHEFNPELKLMVENGLTFGKMQDWNELENHNKSMIGKMMDRHKFLPEQRAFLNNLYDNQQKWLFEKYGAGLKALDALENYKKELKRNPDMDSDERAKIVARFINQNYGGLNLVKMKRNPSTQHLMRLLLLAPDWTESNLQMAADAFKTGNQGDFARRMWARTLIRGAVAVTAGNLLMALSSDDEDDGLSWEERVKQRYAKAWKEGRLRWLDLDVTPLYRALGGSEDKRMYFSVFGHFIDPLKMITNPTDFLENKLNPAVTKPAFEALTGENWKHEKFTTVDELVGLDDKGLYKTNQSAVGKKKPHAAGEGKGGKLAGHLTSPSFESHGGIGYKELPSWALSQVRAAMPTQIQNIEMWGAGENDAVYSIAQSIGLGMKISAEKPDEKEVEPTSEDNNKKIKPEPIHLSTQKIKPEKSRGINLYHKK